MGQYDDGRHSISRSRILEEEIERRYADGTDERGQPLYCLFAGPICPTVDAIVAGIHAEVRKGIEQRRDGDRLRVIRHNIGIMFWLYLRIVIGFWVAGMLYVALS